MRTSLILLVFVLVQTSLPAQKRVTVEKSTYPKRFVKKDSSQLQQGTAQQPAKNVSGPMEKFDADKDGVTDQFDIEPNTPAGCRVSPKGISMDIDGDGVADCRDKELLTPQSCFPVNIDGVGNCPESACLKEIRDQFPTVNDISILTKMGRDALASARALIKDIRTTDVKPLEINNRLAGNFFRQEMTEIGKIRATASLMESDLTRFSSELEQAGSVTDAKSAVLELLDDVSSLQRLSNSLLLLSYRVQSKLDVPVSYSPTGNNLLQDEDNDGVPDPSDQENNTPMGCPVDYFGNSRDGDGDGVPDCRDRELITHFTCFPVNADGIGQCAEPFWCSDIKKLLAKPKPTSAEGILLANGRFLDDFTDNRNNWLISADADHEVSLTNGKLRFRGINNDYNYSRNQKFNLDLHSDFSVQVTARWFEGITNHGYGINFCSNTSTNSHYIFFISANGYYSIKYYESNGTWKSLKDWVQSSYVNPNTVPNILSIKKTGNYIRFYINDNLVETMPFDGGYGTSFGLRVSQAQTIDFDNFTVTGSSR